MLDVWGVALPDLPVPHEQVTFRTRDGVRLAASYLHGPPDSARAVVLAPGFAGHRRKPAYARLATQLSRTAAVLSVDPRGHGGSQGTSTWGDREELDVRAAAAWLRTRGHPWVAGIGVSMGGTAVLRAAGLGADGTLDAVCAISTPAVWGLRQTPAMRLLTFVATSGWARTVTRAAARVRVAPRWGEPAHPCDVVGSITPTPLLLCHGEDDHFFGVEQARTLHAAAHEPKALWIEPAGFRHAEDGLTGAFSRRLADAIGHVHRTGHWPARPASRHLASAKVRT